MENDLIKKAEELHSLLLARGLRMSIAESCTGGLICHAITSLSGASKVFHSGIVPYSTDAKLRMLGIDEDLTNQHGSVSAETAKAMAEAMREKTGVDIGLSVTGNIGPEAIECKPVGLVYFAVSSENEIIAIEKLFIADRLSNKYQAARAAIEFVIQVVNGRIHR
jgi:nicotinamide-nucleotide amidase